VPHQLVCACHDTQSIKVLYLKIYVYTIDQSSSDFDIILWWRVIVVVGEGVHHVSVELQFLIGTLSSLHMMIEYGTVVE
jgi:hypothetical protein